MSVIEQVVKGMCVNEQLVKGGCVNEQLVKNRYYTNRNLFRTGNITKHE